MAKLSIGTWAYIFNQEQPTNDFHVILHKLQDLGYDGVELGSFGPHPSPVTEADHASPRGSDFPRRGQSPCSRWPI